MGCSNRIVNWFASYLSKHRQRVVIYGQSSDWVYILAGVPQGSILGPLLFLIYINDIVKHIGCSICLFADDASFFFIILFQNIPIYTILNNTYYIHLLYILREREREREREVLYNTFRLSLLCIYSTISFVWVTYLVWCKSTSVFVTFITSRLIVGIRIDTYMYDLRNCFIHHYTF